MAELTGVTVGNYFLLECLGREGMVESYRARPTTRGGFDVALRIFRPSFPDSTAFQEHFVSEVEKVWRCHHEHIQPLLEFGSGADLLYTVTEFPEEKTLEHVLEHGENEEYFKSIPHIVRAVTQVCDALYYAHKQHIVHGNIQPSSLLIQPDQDILLTNFSMKRFYGEFSTQNSFDMEPCFIFDCDITGIIWIDWYSQLLFHTTTAYTRYSRSSVSC